MALSAQRERARASLSKERVGRLEHADHPGTDQEGGASEETTPLRRAHAAMTKEEMQRQEQRVQRLDHEWCRELVDQVHTVRGVAVGGILNRYIKERERENLTSEPGEEPSNEGGEQLFFGWKQQNRRYQRIHTSV